MDLFVLVAWRNNFVVNFRLKEFFTRISLFCWGSTKTLAGNVVIQSVHQVRVRTGWFFLWKSTSYVYVSLSLSLLLFFSSENCPTLFFLPAGTNGLDHRRCYHFFIFASSTKQSDGNDDWNVLKYCKLNRPLFLFLLTISRNDKDLHKSAVFSQRWFPVHGMSKCTSWQLYKYK